MKINVPPAHKVIHAKVIQAHNSNYWHYFMVATMDSMAFFPPRFFSEKEAIEHLKVVAKENPTLDLGVTHGKVLARGLPEFDLRLDQIHCPHTREFFRAHRERIAELVEKDDANE